jgi:ParB-like chromosome segregation protein Spo0J
MTPDQLQILAANIERDGVLTSVPLVYLNPDDGKLDIVSGHHRIKAARMALGDDVEADVMVVLDAQSLAELRARQMSHNSISGQDDPALLKQLWEEIDDVDWRAYAGLDDKTLELLEKVDLSSLGEANLDYLTVQILFLPHEVDRARKAMDTVAEMLKVDERWLAREETWDRLVDALDTARGSHNVVNTAAAFDVILDLFERHVGDLQEGWFDAETETVKHEKWVPVETLLGTRSMPAESAAIVAQAFTKMRSQGDLSEGSPWRMLEFLAAEYLAGP